MESVHILLSMATMLSITEAVAQTKTSKTMKNETVETFNVLGISLRINNENGKAAEEVETLWGRFWTEQIQKQIPNKLNDDIYAVYTDYESDFTGPYTMIIGFIVDSIDTVPEGLVGITIEKAVYKKFVSRGIMPEAILSTWREIWQDKKLKRSYATDFTIHGEKYYDVDQAEVNTFISVEK